MEHESLSHAHFDIESLDRNTKLLDEQVAKLNAGEGDNRAIFKAKCRTLIALPDSAEREELRSNLLQWVRMGPKGEFRDHMIGYVEELGTSAGWDAECDRQNAIIRDDERPLHERLDAIAWAEGCCTGTRTLKLFRLMREHFLVGYTFSDLNDDIAALAEEIEKCGVGNNLDYEGSEANDGMGI